MPVKKRKRGQIRSPPTPLKGRESGLLRLPQEIKLVIYEYCYVLQSYEGRRLSGCRDQEITQVTRVASSKPKERAFFKNSRCSHPLDHQSLLLTCRQTYADVWPFYIACHSRCFHHPIRFANDFLSFQTPHQLRHIKHLSLRAFDESIIYNSVSPYCVRSMASNLQRTFDHYPDVFYNLLSFTWEIRDPRGYNPNHTKNQRMMLNFVLLKLVENHKHERVQAGFDEPPPEGSVRQFSTMHYGVKKWRTGCAARMRNLKVDNIQKQHDESSLIFFERLQSGEESRTGLQYINVAKWLREPLTITGSVAGQRLESSVEPMPSFWPRDDHPYTKIVPWILGNVDYRSGTDWLNWAVIIDVGT